MSRDLRSGFRADGAVAGRVGRAGRDDVIFDLKGLDRALRNGAEVAGDRRTGANPWDSRNCWSDDTSLPVEPSERERGRVSGAQAVEVACDVGGVLVADVTSSATIWASRTCNSAYKDWMSEAVELAVTVGEVFGDVSAVLVAIAGVAEGASDRRSCSRFWAAVCA